MARDRITQVQVDQQVLRVARLMNDDLRVGLPILWQGSHENGVANRLMLDGMNMWPDGMAGTTRRDCYNALRVMASSLSAVVEHQENVRRIRAMSGGSL